MEKTNFYFLTFKMGLEPESEAGKRLLSVLQDLLTKPDDRAFNKLKRLLLMYSSKVKSWAEFILAPHAQGVLDETPSMLSERIPKASERCQHAMELRLGKSCAKELVVALEWSENEDILTHVLNWAETSPREVKESSKRVPAVNLAPEHVQKRKLLSEIGPGTATPRYRKISWGGEEKYCTAIEESLEKIIVGWSNGQIGIYNSVDLSCQTMLNCCGTCLQCTGAEIFAGYTNGNFCVWNIAEESVVHRFSLRNKKDDDDEDHNMCYKI